MGLKGLMTERTKIVAVAAIQIILIILTVFRRNGMHRDGFSVIVNSAVCADRRAFTREIFMRLRSFVRGGILEPIALRLRFKIYEQGPRTIFSDIITGSRAREGGRFSRSNIYRVHRTHATTDNERSSRRYAHAIYDEIANENLKALWIRRRSRTSKITE